MTETEKRVPDLRFKGFIEDWEQRKLGDIAEIKTGPFGSTLHAEDYVQSGIPIITTEHFKSGHLPESKDGTPQVSDEDYSRLKSYILKKGDIVFSRVGSVDINALVTTLQDGWLFSGRVLRVRSQNQIDSDYLHYLLDTLPVKNDIVSRAVGQTMPSINTEILKSTKLVLSKNIEEQELIAGTLRKLDDTLALHQRQLENYSQLKNAMIQKIFNKELRFKNENGNDYSDWEKKRLGEILAEVVRKSTKQDQHVILSSTNKGLFLQSEYFISNIASADNIGYKIMRKSEIVFSPQNLWMGNINYNDKYEIGLVSPSYKIFAISEEVIPKFMKYMIKTPYLMNEYLLSSEQGASVVRRNLDMDLFNKILVEIPSLPEQHQIASFLVALDCNIDQLTRKIELVKDKKKGLLQLMFI